MSIMFRDTNRTNYIVGSYSASDTVIEDNHSLIILDKGSYLSTDIYKSHPDFNYKSHHYFNCKRCGATGQEDLCSYCGSADEYK